MTEYDEAWLSTEHVPKFYFLKPRQEDIDIRDIAQSLARTCRFGGHGEFFYSVAEHSIYVTRILEKQGANILTQLAGLLHDAEEAYLPDIPSPIKYHMPETKALYKVLADEVFVKFKVLRLGSSADWTLIKDIDKRICTTEAKALGLWNKDWAPTGKSLRVQLVGWTHDTAERLFLAKFVELGGVLP